MTSSVVCVCEGGGSVQLGNKLRASVPRSTALYVKPGSKGTDFLYWKLRNGNKAPR